jgi:hypothetical protein
LVAACQPEVFNYIQDGDLTVFESEPLENLANAGQLYTFKHSVFCLPSFVFCLTSFHQNSAGFNPTKASLYKKDRQYLI